MVYLAAGGAAFALAPAYQLEATSRQTRRVGNALTPGRAYATRGRSCAAYLRSMK